MNTQRANASCLSCHNPGDCDSGSFRRDFGGRTLLQAILAVMAISGFNGCGKSAPMADIQPKELTTEASRLARVQFSVDQKQLAAADTKGGVYVWDDLAGSPKKLQSPHSAVVLSLNWSPDRLLAVTDLQQGFVGWQFGSGQFEPIELPGLPAPAICVAFRPRSSPLEMVIGLRDGSLLFLGKGQEQLKPDHRGPVKQATYSADGNWLITAGADGQLVWRETSTRKVAAKVAAHEAEISRLVLGPDDQLASADWNGRIKVWSSKTRKLIRESQQPEAVSGLGWLGPKLVSSGWDGTLRVWSSSGSAERTVLTGEPIHDLTASGDRGAVATVGLGRLVRLWQLTETTR